MNNTRVCRVQRGKGVCVYLLAISGGIITLPQSPSRRQYASCSHREEEVVGSSELEGTMMTVSL